MNSLESMLILLSLSFSVSHTGRVILFHRVLARAGRPRAYLESSFAGPSICSGPHQQ